jgi:hypothetical protein
MPVGDAEIITWRMPPFLDRWSAYDVGPLLALYDPDHQRQRRRKPRPATPGGLLTAAQAAAKLGCSIKTLNGHVVAGAVGYVVIGHGRKRPRKMFTDSDLDAFIAAQTRKDSPCPSTASRARYTSTSTSSGTVIDFTAPRKPPTGDKRKR